MKKQKTDPKQLANEYFEDAGRFYSEGRLTESLLALQKAKELFRESGNLSEYARSVNFMGVIYGALGISQWRLMPTRRAIIWPWNVMCRTWLFYA